MKKLFSEIGILILGAITFPLVFVVGIFYTFFKHLIRLDYSLSKQLAPVIRSISMCLNGFANSGAGELINDALKIKGVVKYGKWYQGISAVSGLVQLHEKDTGLRRFLDKFFKFDKDHCYNSITEADKMYYEKLNN